MPAITIVGLAACGANDSETSDAPTGQTPAFGSHRESLSKGESVTISLKSTSASEALRALESSAPFKKRSRKAFVSISSLGRPLAVAADSDSLALAVATFLTEFGAVFVPKEESVPSAPIELILTKAPVAYKRGQENGVALFFRQRFGSFLSEEVLGATFVGNGMVSVAGTIRDPQIWPGPHSVVPTESHARAIFDARGAITASNAAPIRGYVRPWQKLTYWAYGREAINAENGEVFFPFAEPEYGPSLDQVEASQ